MPIRICFKWLHIIVSNAKTFVSGTFHGLGEKHLQSYLDEYCYRFNRRGMGIRQIAFYSDTVSS